jgi:patatin-like phospholipase/acyl hydrolase
MFMTALLHSPQASPKLNTLSAAPRFRLLSLSGGGYLGLFTAAVLDGLEQRWGQLAGQRVGLVAGTSVGAILAAAVATDTPMRQMVALFQAHGAEVFSRHPLPSSVVSSLWDMSRSVLGPKYDGRALRALLQAQWGDVRLGDLRHRLLVPAVEVGRSQTKVFKTPHALASSGDERLRLVDVVMASCAAPAYFPSVRVGEGLYADGGLFAVAPDQVALHEAEHFLQLPLGRLELLAIGTATRRYRSIKPSQARAGAVQWLAQGRLVLTLMASQQQHVQAMMEDRMGERYRQLDADWPASAGLGLDVATPQATQTLLALAEEALRQWDAQPHPAWLPASGATEAAATWADKGEGPGTHSPSGDAPVMAPAA